MPSDRSGTIPKRVSLKYRSERIGRRSYDYRPAIGCREHPLAALCDFLQHPAVVVALPSAAATAYSIKCRHRMQVA